jgi:hypothetical protein
MNGLLRSIFPAINVSSKTESRVSPDTNLPFPLNGLTIDGIHHFVEMIGGKKVLADLTTDQVCQKFVKPMTKVKICSSYFLSIGVIFV